MTPLCELAKKYKTDKGGAHLTYGDHTTEICHNYTPTYYELFRGRERDVEKVLEIGINAGCSQRMWEEFFPNAEIIGLDIVKEYLFNSGRIRSFYADQFNPASLRKAVRASGSWWFDLIVDDGSHRPEHQAVSMQTLLPYLSTKGVYIIEDLECSPESLGKFVLPGFRWWPVPTTGGIGRAKDKTEMLLVICNG